MRTQVSAERHSWFSHSRPGRAMNMQITSYTAVTQITALPLHQSTALHGLINGCVVAWRHQNHTG